jgi:hypothetical protein
MIESIKRLTEDDDAPYVKLEARLYAKHYRYDGAVHDLGLIANKKVTTVFVNHLVDMLQNSPGTNFTDYKYHISGENTASESNADTVSTFATVDDNATVGTQTEGASNNIYKTVATTDYTAPKAVAEHGILNANDTASGILMDRSVFAEINVTGGDSIEWTYELTANAEA